MKIVLFVLIVIWGVFVAIRSVSNEIWEQGAAQMIGAVAVIVLAMWAASQLVTLFAERRASGN